MQVYFSVYEQLKTSLSYRARGNDWIKQPAIHMGAACGAGAACAAFSNPLFVVKTRLQTQHLGLKTARASGPLYKGTFDALTRIAREEGVAGLYRCVNIYSISCPELSALASAVQQLRVPSETWLLSVHGRILLHRRHIQAVTVLTQNLGTCASHKRRHDVK